MKVGELLAVLVLVVHGAFESQAGEVLEDEVVVLGDAAARTERERERVNSVKPRRRGSDIRVSAVSSRRRSPSNAAFKTTLNASQSSFL